MNPSETPLSSFFKNDVQILFFYSKYQLQIELSFYSLHSEVVRLVDQNLIKKALIWKFNFLNSILSARTKELFRFLYFIF